MDLGAKLRCIFSEVIADIALQGNKIVVYAHRCFTGSVSDQETAILAEICNILRNTGVDKGSAIAIIDVAHKTIMH